MLLAAPLNVAILQGLAKGPKQQAELRRDTGSPPQTTLRAQLKRLVDIEAISKQRRNRFPGILEYELTAAGGELLSVAAALDRWLELAPEAPLALGGDAAKAAIKSLADGWSTQMLRALAARPLSLTELTRVIVELSYPSLERRLAAMRLAGQVEPCPGNGRGTPYAVTEWLRRSVAPLAEAARWERRHLPTTTPAISPHDAEAAFLLALPLLQLPPDISGSCRMAADIPSGKGPRLAGAMVEVKEGKIASCSTQLQGHPDAWVVGSATAWLSLVIDHDTGRLEIGGDCTLAHYLLDALHATLFGDELDPGRYSFPDL